jgi:hypothetical protein
MLAQHKAAAKYAELAERVLSKYPKERLLEAEDEHSYKFKTSPEDDRMWASFHQQCFMSLRELQKLSRWKTGGRQQGNISVNSNEAVKAVTRTAIAVDSEVPNEPALPIGILTTLQGVEIPTASTVMTVWDPKRFAILDVRVWRALSSAAQGAFRPLESTRGNRRPFRLQEANTYQQVIREVAARTSMTCREIDKALWVIGEGND